MASQLSVTSPVPPKAVNIGLGNTATSLAALTNFAMLLFFLPSKGVSLSGGHILLDLFRVLVAATLAVTISRLWPFAASDLISGVFGRSLDLVVGLLIAGTVYVGLCFLMRVKQISTLRSLLTNRKQ